MPAAAQDWTDNYYVGLRAIGSVAELGDTSTTGFTGPVLVENDSDEVAGVAGLIGYTWKNIPLRTEIEAAYRFRFDWDVRDQPTGGTVDYEMNIATTSVLFNAMLEWRNSSDFTPFVGGSVGWARNSTDTTRTVIASQAKADYDQDKDNLAYGGIAGVDWAFMDSWSAEFAYRYIELGDAETGAAPATGETISTDGYESHDVLLSVIYKF